MRRAGGWLMVAMLAGAAAPSGAQVRTVDPNDAVSRDVTPLPDSPPPLPPPLAGDAAAAPAPSGPAPEPVRPAVPVSNTYQRDDVIGAAEKTFGKGAAGLAEIIEKVLKEQGEPNAYIAGSEGAGAVVLGLRYGKGLLSHRVEGEQPVYWTGPSVGFDLGGDANKVFVLVYNLYDTQDLYRRFPAAEGRLYFIGGFAATYLRRGDVVLIPIRLGLGYRAGVNIGYMKFSHTAKWLPF